MRPGHVTPYFWRRTGPERKIEMWKYLAKEEPKRKASRDEAQILEHIPDDDLDEFKTLWKECRELWSPPVPAMPVHATINYSTMIDGDHTYVRQSIGEPDAMDEVYVLEKPRSDKKLYKQPRNRKHQEREAAVGQVSSDCWAMVHVPLSDKQVRSIPDAEIALEKEWHKLESQGAWLPHTVQPKAAVMENARRQGKNIHIGKLIALCHFKHAERMKPVPSTKGE